MESGISAMLPSISMRLGFDIAAAAGLGAVHRRRQRAAAVALRRAGRPHRPAPRDGAGLGADRAGHRRAAARRGAAAARAVAVGFVLGGVGGAVYTLVVIELGHRLAGSGLVKAMGLLVSAYTGGTVGGPVLGGWLFDARRPARAGAGAARVRLARRGAGLAGAAAGSALPDALDLTRLLVGAAEAVGQEVRQRHLLLADEAALRQPAFAEQIHRGADARRRW